MSIPPGFRELKEAIGFAAANGPSFEKLEDGRVKWVETCFCATPLAEEREYWDEYFDLEKVQDAHARSKCRDQNGTEPWACGDCDCTARLEARLAGRGRSFLEALQKRTTG